MARGMIHEAHALNRLRKATVVALHLYGRGWTAYRLRNVTDQTRETAAKAVGQTVAEETWEWVVVVMETLEAAARYEVQAAQHRVRKVDYRV